jgi:leader peptidase (prepilin peptidase)/N-methyltransferase
MHSLIPYVLIFSFGLIVGSFLNVCIYRIPRGLSIILPASRCPSCDTPIKPWDNIPIVSYMLLGGKCRDCKARISLRYPLVEFLNAVLYLTVYWKFGVGLETLVYFIFSSALIVITFIDLDFQIIPDSITLAGIPLGFLAGSFLLPDPLFRSSLLGMKTSFIGLITGFGLFYLVALAGSAIFKKEALGGGDIKLMAMVGAAMGWKAVILTTFLGSLAGSVFGIALMILKGKNRTTKIAFGPFLALGAVITLFFGQEIFFWYIGGR